MSGAHSAPARTGLGGVPGGTRGAALWALVVLGLVVAAVVLGLRLHGLQAEAAARDDALTAARQEALNFTTLSAKDADAATQRVLDGATGDFRTQYAAQLANLRKVTVSQKVVSTGNVLDAALVRVDSTSGTALVVVDSAVSNAASPKATTRNYRLQLDLQRVGSRWLTSNLQFVG